MEISGFVSRSTSINLSSGRLDPFELITNVTEREWLGAVSERK